MSTTLNRNRTTNKKALIVLTTLVIALVAFTILQDFLYAYYRRTSFYFSESYIFSSFWWLFIPLLYAQYVFVHRFSIKNLFSQIVVVTLPVILHLFAYPALVWLISELFYYHTFRYVQTLQYNLSLNLYKLVFLYTVPVMAYLYFRKKAQIKNQEAAPVTTTDEHAAETVFIVSEGSRKIRIEIADIQYFSAQTPYISIHTKKRKYLYNETLKSVSGKIDSNVFVRIHKSVIVNINQVQFYTSRLNGDYDLTMCDGEQLRVSRNYAAGFKKQFRQSHPVTAK